MRVSKRQLKRIIKEEKIQLLVEQGVPLSLIERLNSAMNDILEQAHLEREVDESAADQLAADIIMEEVWGFMESIGMQGYAGLP